MLPSIDSHTYIPYRLSACFTALITLVLSSSPLGYGSFGFIHPCNEALVKNSPETILSPLSCVISSARHPAGIVWPSTLKCVLSSVTKLSACANIVVAAKRMKTNTVDVIRSGD